jgi:hypothetical protein
LVEFSALNLVQIYWQRNWHDWRGRVISERPENWTGDLALVVGADLARYRAGTFASRINADGAFLAKADFSEANLRVDSSFRGATSDPLFSVGWRSIVRLLMQTFAERSLRKWSSLSSLELSMARNSRE